MSETALMPPEVNLCSIVHRVQESEGLIVFSERTPVWGMGGRMSFTRRCGCWYVSIHGYGDAAMVGHIVRAMEEVAKVYGGDFEGRNGEHRP